MRLSLEFGFSVGLPADIGPSFLEKPHLWSLPYTIMIPWCLNELLASQKQEGTKLEVFSDRYLKVKLELLALSFFSFFFVVVLAVPTSLTISRLL